MNSETAHHVFNALVAAKLNVQLEATIASYEDEPTLSVKAEREGGLELEQLKILVETAESKGLRLQISGDKAILS